MAKVQNRSTKQDTIIAELPAACSDEKTAVEFMEKQRWGDHAACPSCGSLNVYKMMDSADPTKRQANFRWRCRENVCNKQFTVRVGTVFEDSRIPMRHWCYGFWRAATSKKGVSALEIKRQTGLAYKSCLFMLHRIRLAMDDTDIEPLNGIIEVDEVFIGGKPRHRTRAAAAAQKRDKIPVIGILQRGGQVRPKVIADVTGASLKGAIRRHVSPSALIYTDEWSGYRGLNKEFMGHETVAHSRNEYVRGNVHTNSIEGFWGNLRRGLDGIYHAVSRKHLHRYLSEFQFRYNNRELDDGERTTKAIKAATGKRLTYDQMVGKVGQ